MKGERTTNAFVPLGLTNSVFHRPVRCSAFRPRLTFTIKQQNMFCTLVPLSAAVAGGNVEMKSPTAQMTMLPGLIATLVASLTDITQRQFKARFK